MNCSIFCDFCSACAFLTQTGKYKSHNLGISIDKLTVFNIVFFGFILGLFAGYYRERSGSIIPAIIVHILFNIGGTLAMLSIGMKFNKN